MTKTRYAAGLIGVVGAFAALVPVAQASPGFQGSPDAIDRAVAARQAELVSGFYGGPDAIDRAVAFRKAQEDAAFAAREHAQLRIPQPMPDLVERTVVSHERNSVPDLSSMPDVLERTASAGQLQYQPVTSTSSRFDWGDFGMGAGAGIGLVLLLGLGSILVVRHSEERVTTA